MEFVLDVKKLTQTPKDKWEAIDLLVKQDQRLLDAINIMESMLENTGEEFWEFHEKAIRKFLEQFNQTLHPSAEKTKNNQK